MASLRAKEAAILANSQMLQTRVPRDHTPHTMCACGPYHTDHHIHSLD